MDIKYEKDMVWMRKDQLEALKKNLDLAQREILCQNCFYKLAERKGLQIGYDPNDIDVEFVELDTNRIKMILKCPDCYCKMEMLS